MTDARTLTTDPPPHGAASPGGSPNGHADDLAATAGLSPAPVPLQRHVPLVQELADELRTLRSSFEGVRFLMRDTEAQLNAVQARLQQLGREATALAPATRFGSAPVTPPFPEHDQAPSPSPVVQDTVAPPVVLRDAVPKPVDAAPAADEAAPADAAAPFEAPPADPAAPADAPSATGSVAPAAPAPAPSSPPPGAATPYVPNPTPGEPEPVPHRSFDTDPAPMPAASAPAPVEATGLPNHAAAAQPPVAEPGPAAVPGPTPAPASGNLEEMARARLVALTMAANQATPDEIERHLRDDLGIADPSVLVDYVFGTGTPDSVVPGWPPQGGAGR